MNIYPHPKSKKEYPVYLGALLQFLENIKITFQNDSVEPESFSKKCRSLTNQFDSEYQIANKVGQNSGHAALRRAIPYLERLIWYWLTDSNSMLLDIVKEEFNRQVAGNKCDDKSANMLRTQIIEIFGEDAFVPSGHDGIRFIETRLDLINNIRSFNTSSHGQQDIVRTLIQQSTYFAFDKRTQLFTPAKFGGLLNMTSQRYEQILNSTERSWKFDGYRTRKAIVNVVGIEFESNNEVNARFIQWAQQFGATVKENVKFCAVSSSDIESDISVIEAQQLSKPFILLAGISGTGKTRFVREQAKLTNPTGSLEETYCLVSVRPDWHEPSDLLGYTTRLSGNAQYVVTDVLTFIVKAWKELLRCDIQVDGQTATGTKEQLDNARPFWLCLDEMNLAPVEQYFADYLSILETREWKWSDSGFVYGCDPLLKATVFNDFFDEERFAVQNNLGLHDDEALWDFFQHKGIAIPPNLIVVGTVNMDETTHGFSRKVLDRALSIDFGEFYPNDFDAFLNPKTKEKKFSFSHFSHASINREFCSIDPSGGKSIALLKAINTVLKGTAFELAFRALNELLLSVQTHTVNDEKTLQAVWDDFLMSKVLPRIEGDLEKLAKVGSDKNLLEHLQTVLEDQLSAIWNENNRPDLHRESMSGDEIPIECRSKRKLEWMMQRLDQFGFTTFWP